MPDKNPQPPRAHDALARALAEHRDGNTRQAVEHYKEVLAADPTRAEVWRYLGAAERDRGEVTAALDGFRKAVDLDPKKIPRTRRNLQRRCILQGGLKMRSKSTGRRSRAIRPIIAAAITLPVRSAR